MMYLGDDMTPEELQDTAAEQRKQRITCEHPGVFATDRTSEHCHTCGREVPRQEL